MMLALPDGNTRGSDMCAERRAAILAGRAKGAVYRMGLL